VVLFKNVKLIPVFIGYFYCFSDLTPYTENTKQFILIQMPVANSGSEDVDT
jgi:hypothetical protein